VVNTQVSPEGDALSLPTRLEDMTDSQLLALIAQYRARASLDEMEAAKCLAELERRAAVRP